ncbi:hypothetical protein QFC22_003959 [Naganishia vaughanmartiniae]|uniref:Uncharacterized protein n=1 Tax=Naganishia vaughanmartiniae TaxID=1424756 RepID=A0ACC2X4P1_9TREE|nr:hypothetical protein QFC22_003959 [Naganishia vaughanmartiniae]
MLRRKSASRDKAQQSKSDSKRPLLSPLFTQFSSPETRYTQSPGSMDLHSSQTRAQEDGRESGNRPESEDRERYRYELEERAQDDQQLADLARGIGGIEHHLDAKKRSEFMQHANKSLHSLLSRHSTILEHGGTDSGPPTALPNQYLPGHIIAPRPGSSTDDSTDLELLKPLPNAHDEYVAHQRNLFPNSRDQAKENTKTISKMHQWMDEIARLQEEIAGMHMQLEGVGTETQGDGQGYELSEKLEDGDLVDYGKPEPGRTLDEANGKGNETRNRSAEEKDKKREDAIMEEMIQKLHNLSKKLQDFHATPHPTISFPSSRGSNSKANAVVDLPKTNAGNGGEKEQDDASLGASEDTEAGDQKSTKHTDLTTVTGKPRGTSTGFSADPEHPKQFLRPKQHRDFAQEDARTPPQHGKKAAAQAQETSHEATTDSNTASAAGTQPRPAARSKPPPTEPADLRRKVLQSYDRARWDSVDSYSPITPLDGSGTLGDVRRPSPVRGWSTVLEG